MNYPVTVQQYVVEGKTFRLCVPDNAAIQRTYIAQQDADTKAALPFWAKVWPAAIALSRFIEQHPHWAQNKNVLEIGAGLGLPSLVAAQVARHVACTDKDSNAIHLVQQSILLNGLKNMSASVLDWNHLPQELHPELVLLSDVAYDPAAFAAMQQVVSLFLEKGSVVLFSTPQRLVAKAMVAQLLPFCTQMKTVMIDDVAVSVMVLRK